MTLVVKRSAVKMWLMAMGGIPLLVISLDVLTNRRVTDWLRELLFRPEDTQIYEPRDVIWAWAMLLFSALVVAWGLKELFVPTKVVECRDEGLALKLRGPFRGPDLIPWGVIDDIQGLEREDGGDVLEVLSLRLLGRADLPDNPWGARWVGERELVVLAEDWAQTPDEVASQIADYAVDAAKRQSRERTASIWSPGDEEA